MQCLVIGMALCLAAAGASAGEVYQWKDANGVTQYSSTPPPKGTYKVREVSSQGASIAAAETAAEPVENSECVNARKNLELLKGKAEVQMDSDGDGKADKTLSEADRGNQTALAEASMKANCAAPAAAKP